MIGILSNLFKKQNHLPLFACDIHAHLLPGVDDGASSMEEALDVLSFMKEEGVETVFLTPHIMADYPNNDFDYLQSQFHTFMGCYAEQSKDKYPKVRLAAEYMLDEEFDKHLKQNVLTYDGRHLLVEMSCVQRPLDLEAKLYEVQLCGYIPILAHPERYQFLSHKEFRKLKEQGCLFQLNLFSLQGFYDSYSKANAVWLLENDMYDFVGTDIHSSSYKELYTDCFFKKKYAEKVEALMKRNYLLVSE